MVTMVRMENHIIRGGLNDEPQGPNLSKPVGAGCVVPAFRKGGAHAWLVGSDRPLIPRISSRSWPIAPVKGQSNAAATSRALTGFLAMYGTCFSGGPKPVTI